MRVSSIFLMAALLSPSVARARTESELTKPKSGWWRGFGTQERNLSFGFESAFIAGEFPAEDTVITMDPSMEAVIGRLGRQTSLAFRFGLPFLLSAKRAALANIYSGFGAVYVDARYSVRSELWFEFSVPSPNDSRDERTTAQALIAAALTAGPQDEYQWLPASDGAFRGRLALTIRERMTLLNSFWLHSEVMVGTMRQTSPLARSGLPDAPDGKTGLIGGFVIEGATGWLLGSKVESANTGLRFGFRGEAGFGSLFPSDSLLPLRMLGFAGLEHGRFAVELAMGAAVRSALEFEGYFVSQLGLVVHFGVRGVASNDPFLDPP